MARFLYGGTPADYTMTLDGKRAPLTPVEVWDDRAGGSPVTDLFTTDGNPTTKPLSDGNGHVRFFAPDGYTDTLWIDSGIGVRLAVRPTEALIAMDVSGRVLLPQGAQFSGTDALKVVDATQADESIISQVTGGDLVIVPSNNVALSGKRVVALGDPLGDSDAATKRYVDDHPAFPFAITHTSDPGYSEFVVFNNYPHTVNGRETFQIWANGEKTFWLNEWGGPRIRVANTSAWDAALRLIGAAGQSGDYLEVLNSDRSVKLMSINSAGRVIAPNVHNATVVLHGADPLPTGLPAETLVARIGGTTVRYNYFTTDPAGSASTANGWDEVTGAPVYDLAYGWNAGMGLRFNIASANPSYARITPPGGLIDTGYARFRVRFPTTIGRKARIFATRSDTTNGTRMQVGVDTDGHLEIVDYDGTTVRATTTTVIPTNTWVDVGVHWIRNAAGTGHAEVRLYTNPLSDTPTETISTNAGNFVGAGGNYSRICWGLIASGTGAVTCDYGMVAHDRNDWIPGVRPGGGDFTLTLWDGSTEIPMLPAA